MTFALDASDSASTIWGLAAPLELTSASVLESKKGPWVQHNDDLPVHPCSKSESALDKSCCVTSKCNPQPDHPGVCLLAHRPQQTRLRIEGTTGETPQACLLMPFQDLQDKLPALNLTPELHRVHRCAPVHAAAHYEIWEYCPSLSTTDPQHARGRMCSTHL